MSIKVKVYGENFGEPIKLIKKHRLYVNLWMIKEIVNYHEEEEPVIEAILILFKDNIPIGVLVDSGDYDGCFTIGVFVRKAERRKGYGTKLIMEYKKHYPYKNIFWDRGIQGSGIFYRKALSRS